MWLCMSSCRAQSIDKRHRWTWNTGPERQKRTRFIYQEWQMLVLLVFGCQMFYQHMQYILCQCIMCLRGVPLYVFPVQLLYNSAYSNLFSWLPFLMNGFLTATCPQRPSDQVSMNRSWVSWRASWISSYLSDSGPVTSVFVLHFSTFLNFFLKTPCTSCWYAMLSAISSLGITFLI